MKNFYNAYLRRIVVATTIVILGSFFIFNGVFAAHTATVTVDKTYTQSGPATYTFNITNNGADSVKIIQITAPSTFTINDVLVCPSEWLPLLNNSSSVACAANELLENYLVSGNSAQISFSATAPSTDGVYNWEVKTKDVLNIWDTKNPTTIIDNTTPIISINAVTTPTKISNQTVTGTFTETNIDNIKVNGVPVTIDGSTYSANITLNEGSNMVTAVATDKVGLTGTANTTIVLDTTAPVTSDNASNNWSKINVTVTLTANDGVGGSGVANTYYATDGAVLPTTPYLAPFIINTEGQHQLTYYSVDNVGNAESVKTGSNVKIDKTPPTSSYLIDPAIPNGNGWYITNVPTITLTCADQVDLSGCEGVYYRWGSDAFTKYTDLITAQEGNKILSYYSKDNAGNTEDTQTQNIKVDTGVPTITDNAPTIWKNSAVSFNLTPVDSISEIKEVKLNGEILNAPYLITYNTEGTFTGNYQAWDNAGNASAIGSYTVSIDKTDPVAGVSGAPGVWVNTNQTATVTCADTGGSDCDANNYKYKVSATDPEACSTTVGEYTSGGSVSITAHSWVCSYVKDNAGNGNFTVAATEFKVDKIAPTGELTGVPENWQNIDATVDLTFGDTGDSGVAGKFLNKVAYGDSCSASTPYSAALTISQHSTVCWKVVDGAGNDITGSKEIKVDKIAPTSEITSPDAGSWFKSDFNVSINDSDAGGSTLNICQYKVVSNGVVTKDWTTRTCSGQIPITVGADKDCKDEGTGKCQIVVRSNDVATNVSSETTRIFNIDWTPPVANISSPINGDIIRSSNVPITFTTDGTISPIFQCFYQIDSQEKQEIPSCGSPYTIINAPDGRHAIKIIAKDSAGNEADSNTVNLLIDIDKTFTVGTTGADFTTIQDAINAADDTGYKIFIKNGHYDLATTLNLTKKLTIEGESQAGVVIDTGGVSGYGITNNNGVNDITLKNFTLFGPSADAESSYGIKATHTNNLTVKDVTVKGSGRSEVDLNTVTTATLENVTADGNNTAGAGIAVSHSSDITLRDITTQDNIWGGVGLYDTAEGATTNVIFAGTNSFGGQNPIYIDAQYGSGASNITLPAGFGYAVRNNAFRPEGPTRSDDFTFYQNSQENAIAAALALQTPPSPLLVNKASYIQTVGTGAALENNFIVGNGMSIQAAISAAISGATINVAAGNYDESIDITKPLIILGHGQADTFIDRSANTTAGDVVSIHDMSGDVKVDGFTIKTGPASTVASNGIHIYGLTGPGSITISNNTILGVQSAVSTVKDNYGLIAGYFTATTPKLVFDHNTVRGGSDNPILIEKWMGPTEITNNYLYQNPLKDFNSSDVIFMMNYDGSHNNAKQLISDNTIDMGWGTVYTYDTRGTGITVAGSFTGNTSLGGFTNVEIKNNTLLNLKPFRRGIGLWNNSSNGTGGEITNAIISGNTISNATGYTGEFGIRDLGKITGTQITNNPISGVIDAVKFQGYAGGSPSGAVVHNNSLVAATLGVNNLTTNMVDATKNWWGTTDGLTIALKVSSNVNYRPWCTDEACSSIDEIVPTITLSITTTSPTNSTSIPVTATFSESVTDFVTGDIVVTNGSVDGFSGSDSSYTFNVLPLTNGEITIKVLAEMAQDLSGNYNTKSNTISVVYDNVAATAAIVAGAPASSTNSNGADITVGGTDVTHYQYKLDGGSYGAETLVGTHITLSGLANGSHTLYVIGRDAAGNWQAESSATTHTWTVDTQAPTVNITAPVSGNKVNASTKIIFTDSEPTNAQCSIDNANWVACVSNTTTLGGVTGFDVLSQVAFTLYLKDTDSVGNPGTDSEQGIVKDITGPSVTAKNPSANAVGVDPSGNITVTFSEKVVMTPANVELKKGETTVLTSVSLNADGTIATIHPLVALDSNSEYYITLTEVTDEAGNIMDNYDAWKFTTATRYSISLTSGWNLISLPVTPTTWRSIPNTLLSVSGKINRIWTYDASYGMWLVYNTDPAVPSDSNFTSLEAGKGYWVEMNTAGILVGSGTLYEQLIPSGDTPSGSLPQVQLAEGWNMIGYYQLPGKTDSPIANALVKLDGAWSGTATGQSGDLLAFTSNPLQVQTPISTMVVGKGYWIYMKSASLYSFGNGNF